MAISDWPTRIRMSYGRVVHAAQPVDNPGWPSQLYALRCLHGKKNQVLGEVPDGGDHVMDATAEITCSDCRRSKA